MSDCISRQAAIDALEEPCKVSDTWTDECAVGERMQWEKDVKALKSLPPAQQECTECAEYDHETKYCPKYCDVIRQTLEEAKQERTGRWLPDNIPGGGFWVCSCCKFPSEAFAADVLYKFCPNCGADMRKARWNG